MACAMCMAVTFILASAVVQANQCSSGGECPSGDEPTNLASLLQTKMGMNVHEDGPSMMTNPRAMPTLLEGMVRSGTNPALDLLEAGSDSIRLSTCFPKGVDVFFWKVFDGRRSSSAPSSVPDVCKLFSFAKLRIFRDTLHLGYDSYSRTLCIKGSGPGTRPLSTVQMIKDAVRSLDKDCKSLSPFDDKVISIGDISDCSHDMAYSAQTWIAGCKTKLIPDFAFYKWPEAGLLPDYKHLTPMLASLGSHPATEGRCGWAGNVATNPARTTFVQKSSQSKLFDIVVPEFNDGPGGQGGRISMEDQVTRWACFVDLPANGYSGRLPYLLQSGRPVLMVKGRCGWDGDLGPGSMAPTWYSHMLKPWVHYIPVSQDMSDLDERAKFALGITPGSNATKIAAAAQKLAQTHLSYDAAINSLADSLLELH